MARLYNQVPNPGGEGATAALEAQSAATVTIVATSGVGWPARGTKSYSITATSTAAAIARLRLVSRATNAAASKWHARAKLRAASGNTGTRRYRLSLVSYSAAPGSTEGTATVLASTDVDLAPGDIQDVAVQADVAAGVLSVGYLLQRVTGVLNAATSDVFHVDDMLLTQWDGTSTPLYGDGDFPAWAWTGAAHASTAYTAIAVPVLTPHQPGPSDAFAPWVEVLLTELWPKAVTATVQRTSEGRTMDVRGAVKIPASGGFSRPDYEIGFGTVSEYRVQMFDGSGTSLGYSETVQITLTSSDAWLQQPLDPALAVRVKVLLGTAAEIYRPTPGELVHAGDGSVPRWLGGRRLGIDGLAVRLLTDAAGSDVIEQMLGDYESDDFAPLPVLLLRTPPPIRIPRVFFADCSGLRQSNGAKDVIYAGSVSEARPPFAGLVAPSLTYDDLDKYWGTYSAQDTRYGSYLEKDRDYSLTGYAS